MRLFATTLILAVSLTTFASIDDFDRADKSVLFCRFGGSNARTLEIAKQPSGDILIRLSGLNLLPKIDPNIRSVEVFYRGGSCNPKGSNSWLKGYLYTCIDSSQVYFRDGNGETLVMKSSPARIFFDTWTWGLLGGTSRYYYELRFTVDGKNISDTVYFDLRGNSECRIVG